MYETKLKRLIRMVKANEEGVQGVHGDDEGG